MFTLYNATVYLSTNKIVYYLIQTLDNEVKALIELRVLELLKENNKTKYWLYKQLGMSYQNFNKMINNETKSIRYENIETMCRLLNCTPNELFRISDDL